MATPRKDIVKRYRTVGSDNQLAHRVRAEKALGKPLPPGVQVHHADGSKSDDAPLVICQNQAYHSLLHVRMRVIKAGGDPDRHRICCHCRSVKLISEMGKRKGATTANQCKACISQRASRWYARKTGKVAS